jgi:hypothetical protein
MPSCGLSAISVGRSSLVVFVALVFVALVLLAFLAFPVFHVLAASRARCEYRNR